MSDLVIWKILAGLLASPAILVVARAIATRFSSVWKARVNEVDYLRAELKNAREEFKQALADLQGKAEQALVDLRAETDEIEAQHQHTIARLHRRVEALENERDRLVADLKVAEFDTETARRFVADATTTRKERK